jgi:hypothetical protein
MSKSEKAAGNTKGRRKGQWGITTINQKKEEGPR